MYCKQALHKLEIFRGCSLIMVYPQWKWQFNGGNDASPMDLGLPNFQSIPTGLQDQNFLVSKMLLALRWHLLKTGCVAHILFVQQTRQRNTFKFKIYYHTHTSCLKMFWIQHMFKTKYPNWTVSYGCMGALNDSSLIKEILKLAIPRKSCKQC